MVHHSHQLPLRAVALLLFWFLASAFYLYIIIMAFYVIKMLVAEFDLFEMGLAGGLIVGNV